MDNKGYQAQTGKGYNDDHNNNDDAMWKWQKNKLYTSTSSIFFTFSLVLFTKTENEASGWLGTMIFLSIY